MEDVSVIVEVDDLVRLVATQLLLIGMFLVVKHVALDQQVVVCRVTKFLDDLQKIQTYGSRNKMAADSKESHKFVGFVKRDTTQCHSVDDARPNWAQFSKSLSKMFNTFHNMK